MTVTEKTKIRTIDCTPTWRGVLPLLLVAYQDGTPTRRAMAMEELCRMADLADAQNETLKSKRLGS